MFKALKYCLISLSIIFVIVACSSMGDYTSKSLANQGILPLSATNAYLGTNLYLAKQAEKSQVLYQFLESKGAPTAIELVDKSFDPPRLILFYPKVQEAYSAELEKHSRVYEWIVRGPYGIKRNDYNTLSRIQAVTLGDPLFVVDGSYKRFKVDRERALWTPTPLPTAIPTPMPTRVPTPKRSKTKIPVITAPGEVAPSIKDFKPLNSDQQAIQISKGYAERSNNGDVLHLVKSETETLASIAKWYTGSEGNAKALSGVNNIADGKTLVKGQKVIVPIGLLKNLKAMP